MEITRIAFTMRWKERGAIHREWNLLGMDEAGVFFGEVTQRAPTRIAQSFQGQLAPLEASRVHRLVQFIRTRSEAGPAGPSYGILAELPRSNPRIIYRLPNPEVTSPAARAFQRLTKTILKHIFSKELVTLDE